MISLTWDYQELTDIIMDMLWISHKLQLLKTLRYIAEICNSALRIEMDEIKGF